MTFPSFEVMAGHGGCTSEDNSRAAIRSATNLEPFARTSGSLTLEVPSHHNLHRVVSEERLESLPEWPAADDEVNSPAAIRSATNLEDFEEFFARTSGSVEVDMVRRTMRKSSSEDQLESLSSAASTISSQSRRGSTFSRCGSSEAVQLLRHVKVATSPGLLQRERPAGAVLPEWPVVDADVVASSKRHLLTYEIDPTTLPTDVLCHLAMEMFVSAGLPAGLAEDRVRRFILAVRASMLDNPYHNFYHVFDVMQTTNALATSTGTMARLDSWERLALLSAALW
ncbi:hypothetical protein T484DRAFT_1819441 [Baffinella frigidus]|nr:hypothetical protein T484DRAFT_1819441 [Cryptophyta sp. CCMP2293]